MAIAPLPQQEEMELFEVPWPKPALRVVRDEESTVRSWDEVERRDAPVRVLRPVQMRRSTVRRRRIAVGVFSALVLLVLSLPIQALGGITSTGKLAPSGVVGGLQDGSLYVVQPGDTVASIAHALNPTGDQAALQSKIRSIVGSSVVVPGEHVLLP